MGKVPHPAALSTQDIPQAEAALGLALPPLLTALYSRIANGGFGREYGLLSLTGCPAPDGEHSAVLVGSWVGTEVLVPNG